MSFEHGNCKSPNGPDSLINGDMFNPGFCKKFKVTVDDVELPDCDLECNYSNVVVSPCKFGSIIAKGQAGRAS